MERMLNMRFEGTDTSLMVLPQIKKTQSGDQEPEDYLEAFKRVYKTEFGFVLEGKPVIVLSNNDGCAVARSAEAKALGIRIGDPEFKIRELIRRENVQVFSSNYALYGDLSRRVGDSLHSMVPTVETYSIDESFLRDNMTSQWRQFRNWKRGKRGHQSHCQAPFDRCLIT